MKYGGHANEEPGSDSSSMSEDVVLADYVQRPLRLRARPKMTQCQKFWTGLFYAQLAFQLIAGVALRASRNVQYREHDGTCADGFIQLKYSSMCVGSVLFDKINACQSNQDSASRVEFTRRLQTKKSYNVWDVLRRHERLPMTTIGVAAIMCVAMLFVLTVAAGCVTWGLFLFNGALLLYGFYLTTNWMLLVALAVVAVLALWRKKDIDTAIAAMEVGAAALKDTPVVFAICAGLQLVWFVYAVVFTWFTLSNMAGSMDVGPDCEPAAMSFLARMYFSSAPFLFVLTTFFFRHCVLAVCSMAVGAWCFKEEAEAQGMSSSTSALLGLKLAFTTSCGSVFAASLILSVVDAIRKKVTKDNMLWWCDPVTCLLKMIWCAVESTIGALTRFALIAHMFQGDGLCFVAGLTGDMLTRQLPGIIICGIVSEKVTRQLAMMSATAVGFYVWWYLDHVEDLGFFSAVRSVADQADDGSSSFGALNFHDELTTGTTSAEADGTAGLKHLILIGLTLVMLWCVRNPVVTIVLAFLVSSFEFGSGWWSCFLIAVVLASLVAVIFNYFASVLEYATDVAFFCTALDAESGQRRTLRLEKLRDIVDDRVSEELVNDV